MKIVVISTVLTDWVDRYETKVRVVFIKIDRERHHFCFLFAVFVAVQGAIGLFGDPK